MSTDVAKESEKNTARRSRKLNQEDVVTGSMKRTTDFDTEDETATVKRSLLKTKKFNENSVDEGKNNNRKSRSQSVGNLDNDKKSTSYFFGTMNSSTTMSITVAFHYLL